MALAAYDFIVAQGNCNEIRELLAVRREKLEIKTALRVEVRLAEEQIAVCTANVPTCQTDATNFSNARDCHTTFIVSIMRQMGSFPQSWWVK